jgi:hypothetical protein
MRIEWGYLGQYSDGRGTIPGDGNVPLIAITSRPSSGVHPASYPVDTGVPSSGVMWAGRELVHLPPPSAEVKNA